MKLLSLFSGIGAFEKALTNLGIHYELVNYCEIDKYASKAYSLIHGVSEELNLGDITKVDVNALPNVDMVTYGFPCQDISLAGKQQGFHNEDGTQTRSGLFFNALEIIQHCKPKIAIAENVKNLLSKRFADEFQTVLNSLDESGYNNYYQILNSKNFGIPQNRERVFIISIRKDVDTGSFKFPEPVELTTCLQDVLENEVDEKYYLSTKGIQYITDETRLNKQFTSINPLSSTLTAKGTTNYTGTFIAEPLNAMPDGVCRTLKAQYYKNGLANLFNDNSKGENFSATGVIVKTNNKKGYDVGGGR